MRVRGAKDAPSTDDDGRFWLILPPEMKPGDALTLTPRRRAIVSGSRSTASPASRPTSTRTSSRSSWRRLDSKRFLSPPAIEALVASTISRAREGYWPRRAPGSAPPRLLPARVGDAVRPVVQGGQGGRRRLGGQGEQQAEHARPGVARSSASWPSGAPLPRGCLAAVAEASTSGLAARRRAHGGAMRDLLKREADADFIDLQFEPAAGLHARVPRARQSEGDPAPLRAAASIDFAPRGAPARSNGSPGPPAADFTAPPTPARRPPGLFAQQFPERVGPPPRTILGADSSRTREAWRTGKAANDLLGEAAEPRRRARGVEARRRRRRGLHDRSLVASTPTRRAARAEARGPTSLHEGGRILRAALEITTAIASR